MKNLILILSFCVAYTSSFAQSPTPTPAPLLRAEQHSGFTPPEYRFYVTCSVTQEGKLHSDVYSGTDGQRGWGAHEIVDRTLTSEELASILTLINAAKAGPFETRQNPCDIGGLAIIANPDGKDLILVDSQDCGMRTTNLNPFAKPLTDWVRTHCKLK